MINVALAIFLILPSFLNESEISICIEALKDFGITDYYFFGGYENSQRKVLGFFR